MRGLLQADAAQAVSAYLAWWELAGVDGAIDEAAVNWLRPPPSPQPRPVPAQSLVAEAKPQSPEAFTAWLMQDPAQPERRWPGRVLTPQGAEGSRLMVIVDMPDVADMAAGTLLTDSAGQLFDAMLAAIGLARTDIYLTSLFFSRPPGGMVDGTDIAYAAERVRTQVALARPSCLLLLGDRTCRAFTGDAGEAGVDHLQFFNHDDVTVPAFATFHPRLLLGQPAAKLECWRILQRLAKEQLK